MKRIPTYNRVFKALDWKNQVWKKAGWCIHFSAYDVLYKNEELKPLKDEEEDPFVRMVSREKMVRLLLAIRGRRSAA